MAARLIALLAAALVASVLTASPAAAYWKACKNDEPVGGPCVWDAKHMGNGTGQSFKVRSNGTVVNLTHRQAHGHIYGW